MNFHYGFAVPNTSNFHTPDVTTLCGKIGGYALSYDKQGHVNCQECLSIGKFLNESGTGVLIWKHLEDVMKLTRLIIHDEECKMLNSIRSRLFNTIADSLGLPHSEVSKDQT